MGEGAEAQAAGSWADQEGTDEAQHSAAEPQRGGVCLACVEHLRTACAREDLLTAEKSLEALRFIVCGFSGAESAKENLEDREELHRSIMQDSEHLYEITRLYQGDRDKIRNTRSD